MTSDIEAVPSEPTREQVNAALLAFYPSDWTRSIQFDAMKRALIAASLCEPAEQPQSPDGRTIDKAMVKRLAVQYGLIDAAPAQSGEPVRLSESDVAALYYSSAHDPLSGFTAKLNAALDRVAPQPSPTAVVLDDERAAFEKLGREFKDCFGHITPEEALRAINACGKFGDAK